jgi:hypothetical protein
MAVLLINKGTIAKYTPLGGNVDTDYYFYLVKDSQEIHIEPILGTKLYEKLQEDFKNDTLTGLYETLVDKFITPILIHMTFSEYVPIAGLNVKNGGIFKHLPENAEPINQEERNSLGKNSRAKADVYIERLNRFLCDKGSEIPEYTQAQDEDYDEKPQRSDGYFGGFFFGDSRIVDWRIDETD